MAISGLTPITALPTSYGATTGGSLLGSPQLGGTNPLLAASAGAAEKPGLLTRLANAMRSAIAELRGEGPVAQSLAAQAAVLPVAGAPVAVAAAGSGSTRPVVKSPSKAKFPNAKTWVDKQGNVRQVGTGKILKAASSGAAAAPAPAAQQPAGAVSGAAAQLPANAAQLPGATVYSYDQYGNPVAPTMSQLGVTPTMLQGLNGLTNAVDPDGPQVNATNQNSIGLGSNGILGGTATPVLGQPILVTDASSGAAGDASPANQAVTNENVTDVASRNQGLGYGWF